jgi:hypothetical protein
MTAMYMKTKQKINVYVGADNKTHRINNTYYRRVLKIVNSYFKGYSLLNSVGYWNGVKEESLIISIIDNRINLESVNNMVEQLKSELKQESILIEYLKVDCEFK